MGIIKQGANGGFSGKAGSVVGSSWRKIDYIKGLPRKRSKAPTEKQLAQQAKFAFAVEFFQPIKELLNMGFADQRRGKATGYNIALRELIKNAIMGDYPDYQIDYSQVQISVGSLYLPPSTSIEATDPGVVKLNWTHIEKAVGAYQGDQTVVVLYNLQKKTFIVIAEDTLRNEGEQEIELPESFSGDELAGWLFFVNKELKRQSKSVYSGTVTVL